MADYELIGRRCEWLLLSLRIQASLINRALSRMAFLPETPFNAPVAQCIEHRASNAEVVGESPSGSATSSRNANRTSVPGLGANEIVLPSCGMRSMSSAFRHFNDPVV